MGHLSERYILDLVRSGRADTQADLCRLTGLRSSTMCDLLKRLRERGLVRAGGMRVVGRGRPATVLRFVPPGHMLGVDIDGTRMLLGVLDFGGRVIAQELLAMGKAPAPRAALRRCRAAAQRLLVRARVPWRDLKALGLSANGAMSEAGLLEYSTVLPWRNAPLAAIAGELFKLPVVCSEGQHRAVAEYRFGLGAHRGGQRVMLYFNVADGVSARPVIDGELMSRAGGRLRNGEIGHVVFDAQGPTCGCGQRGCLEALISGPALCRQVLEHAVSNRAFARQPGAASLLAAAQDSDAAMVVDHLVEMARQGQSDYAGKLLDQTVRLAGRGLAMATACFGPDVIVVDGYIFRDHPALMETLRAQAQQHYRPAASAFENMTIATLGEESRLVALVTLVSDRLASQRLRTTAS